MNIFVLSYDAESAASMMCDKHIPKMIVESCQMLSTAHRVLDGQEYMDKTATGRSVKRWRLKDQELEDELHHACYVNHPCTQFCRDNRYNYLWLYRHLQRMLQEYLYRFSPDRGHACETVVRLLCNPPSNIPSGSTTNGIDWAVAMPDVYKVYDVQGRPEVVSSYRNFYIRSKSRFAKWRNLGQMPSWYYEGCKNLNIPMLNDCPELDELMSNRLGGYDGP